MFCPTIFTVLERIISLNLTTVECGTLLKDKSLSFVKYLVSDGSYAFIMQVKNPLMNIDFNDSLLITIRK